nr:hypothetical protein [Rhodococcus sp. 15-1154-1]
MLALSAPMATAQQEPDATPMQTPCTDYAMENYGTGFDWTCFGDTLTVTVPTENDSDPSATVIDTSTGEEINPDDPAQTPDGRGTLPEGREGPEIMPRARIDDSHSVTNYEQIIWNYSDGTNGSTSISMRVSIYNHSGNISVGFQDEVPIELRFQLRIREDRRPFMSDLDIYEYADDTEYNLGVPALNGTVFEPYWDEGFDKLPYPSEDKRYFWDIHHIYIAAEGRGWLTANLFGLGSSQSDRVTCGPVRPCRFVEGNT